ncbi:MAG: hypothetical protein ACYDD0_00910 [Candidatus Dormibacteria bacterium]
MSMSEETDMVERKSAYEQREAERLAKLDRGALELLVAAKVLQDEPDRYQGAGSGPRDDLKSVAWTARNDTKQAIKRAREVLWQERSLEGAIARLEAKP